MVNWGLARVGAVPLPPPTPPTLRVFPLAVPRGGRGESGKWKFTAYSGNARYGFAVTRTGGMGNGLVKGKSGNIWIKGWSTVIGANTPYLSVTPDTTHVASSVWDEYAGGVLVTGKKCGDYYVKAEIRSGAAQTLTHSITYTYTVIPDIVGDTAYVQNVGTSRYIDLEQVNYVPTDIVQQWSFHTGTQAQWIFELGGNGYLKIKSVKTGKYIGVDSTDTTKVKQYSTVTDYTLWKLTETTNGRYKISCKASALSGKVLCAPTSASGNGADLTMLAYVSDSDYKDEWKIYHLQNIIGGVPTSLRSNDTHYCIPCAITNIAGYWSNNGYSQFGCATATNQESAAVAVQAKMNEDSGSVDGYSKNSYIPNGFDFFTCTSAGKEYSLESQNIWQSNSAFSIDLIINEIDAGRPVMLGYGNGAGTPYVNHMTVCTGYDFAGDDVYVYVSDAHEGTYQVHLFNGTTYNNFIATVKCTIESN